MKASEHVQELARRVGGLFEAGELPAFSVEIVSIRGDVSHSGSMLFLAAHYKPESDIDLALTIAHELIHMYHESKNIQDTSNRGRYHQILFERAAADIGIIATTIPGKGYARFAPTERFIRALSLETLPNNEADLPVRMYKFECPICGGIIYSNIKGIEDCPECVVPLIRTMAEIQEMQDDS